MGISLNSEQIMLLASEMVEANIKEAEIIENLKLIKVKRSYIEYSNTLHHYIINILEYLNSRIEDSASHSLSIEWLQRFSMSGHLFAKKMLMDLGVEEKLASITSVMSPSEEQQLQQ